MRELLNLLAEFDKIGVGFRSLADVWCDTTTAHGRLMLTVLGGLAEFERELIRQRTGEGRARALAAGVRFGRKPKLSDFQRKEAAARRGNGETLAADREELRGQCEYDQQAVEEERMAKFLAFKDHRGQEIYVNAALVRAVRSEGESGAWIDFDGSHSIRTPSPANTVVRDLEKAV